MQKYIALKGKELKSDNGSGYSVLCGHEGNPPFAEVEDETEYVVGWNGVGLDNSTLNLVVEATPETLAEHGL